MASLSCKISPRTSTVIFFDKSPLATAMVTSAMLRTCAVRLDAIELTLSVRSFHTPVTPPTWAWPPSLPSVPTSRATRVTSEVNTLSCLIIVLTISADRRNSPFSGRPSTSRLTVRSRSPCATAAMARVTSVVGHSRSSISELTEDSISPQAPSESPKRTRCRVLPSRPTTWPTRSSWPAMRSLVATISLKVSAILPMMPTRSPAMRTEKLPTRIDCSACKSSVSPLASPLRSCSSAGGIASGWEEPLAAVGSSCSAGVCIRISRAHVYAGVARGSGRGGTVEAERTGSGTERDGGWRQTRKRGQERTPPPVPMPKWTPPHYRASPTLP